MRSTHHADGADRPFHVRGRVSLDGAAAGSVRLFSIRHEFPSEWAKFKNVKITGNIKTAELILQL